MLKPLALALSLALPAAAFAAAPGQTSTPPAAPGLDGGLGGPLVPAVCLLSTDGVVTGSTVGQAANTRLTELAQAAQKEIEARRAPLAAEANALSTTSSPPGPAQAQRRQALADKMTVLQAETNQRSQELGATRTKVLTQIATAAQPLINAAYARHGCGLLLRREAALGGNFGNDLTPEVIKALNASMPTIAPFERERLPPPLPSSIGRVGNP